MGHSSANRNSSALSAQNTSPLVSYKHKNGNENGGEFMCTLPFSDEEYAARYDRVRAEIERAGLDAVVITSHMDFYWLTGTRVNFWSAESPQWLIIPLKGEPTGVVRRLEASTHKACAYLHRIVSYKDEGSINPYDPVKTASKTIEEMGLADKRIGVSYRTISTEDFLRFKELLPRARFEHFNSTNIRVRRTPAELAVIRTANAVNQRALMETIEELHPGMSEWGILKYVARKHANLLGTSYVRSAMESGGCQVGRNMQLMHSIRTPAEMKKSKIKPGDGVWMEPGVLLKEYIGSMLRTVWFGPPPKEVRDAMQTMIAALELLLETAGPGKTAHEIDAVVRAFLEKRGYHLKQRIAYTSSEKWLDGGILSITPGNPLVLEPGQVFHSPVHVDVPGYGFMGVSEQWAVTEKGIERIGDFDRSCPLKFFVKIQGDDGVWRLTDTY